jgi:hypothetical protein
VLDEFEALMNAGDANALEEAIRKVSEARALMQFPQPTPGSAGSSNTRPAPL